MFHSEYRPGLAKVWESMNHVSPTDRDVFMELEPGRECPPGTLAVAVPVLLAALAGLALAIIAVFRHCT